MEKIKYNGTDEIVYYERLKNGLEVYMYPSNTAKNFYLTFNTKFGSMDTEFKYEKNKKTIKLPRGTAHFLEHQLFEEGNEETAFEKFAMLGSSVNAFTTYDLTCYEVIASENFKENLELLLDFVQNPNFTEKSVKSEKGIIKEEINMYDNNPNARLNFGLEYNLNVKDNHKYTISGNLEDIKKITPDILYRAYDAFYQPSNMFLVLTGKFKPLEALGIIKENQNKKDFSPYKKCIKVRIKEPAYVSQKFERVEMDVTIPKIKIAYKIPKKSFKEFTDLYIKIYLDAILSIKFGATSDTLEKLINDNLISWDIETSRDIRSEYVIIYFQIESDYKDEIIELIRENLHSLEISKEEMMRIKRVNIANFILHFNDIITVAEDIQEDIITNQRIITDILNVYKSLNVSDANKIIKGIELTNESIFIVDKIDEK